MRTFLRRFRVENVCRVVLITGVALGFSSFSVGCKSAPPVKTQGYAKLKNERDFEYEFVDVWRAIERVVKDYPLIERDPKPLSEFAEFEAKKVTELKFETDWIYTQSRDKFFEYKINGQPRKKYLQARVKYSVLAKTIVGGVNVVVKTHEEVELVKKDGSPDGYERMENADSSRASELLDKVQTTLYAQAGQPGEPPGITP